MESPVNLGEIRSEVELLAPQPDYSSADYNNFINEALQEVAGEIIIPDLKRMDSVTTDSLGVQNWVSLSSIAAATLPVSTHGFAGTLRRVRNMTINKDVTIYPKLENLFDHYRQWITNGVPMNGDVRGVALEGATLWYMQVPSVAMGAQTLMILYTAAPPPLINDTDESFYPGYLQRRLLIHGAARLVWNLIETDIEQPKVQTTASELQFQDGITKYREYISRRTRHVITSIWRD